MKASKNLMRYLPGEKLFAALTGLLIVAGLGWACFRMPFASSLSRLSYDLPFPLRSKIATSELCLVIIDEKSSRALNQPLDAAWDRRLHAQLLKSLTEAGARAVLFDLILDSPSNDPAADEEFAQAIRENGKVFLGADLRMSAGRGSFEEQTIPPLKSLRSAAAGWGLLLFRPVDPDYGVRQIFTGTEETSCATWRMARFLGAPLPEVPDESAPAKWLNYYAPSGVIRSVGYQEALRPAELAPDFFRDRIVVIGGRRTAGSLLMQKDEFLTPYTRWGQSFAGGVEIHATILLNLIRGDWLLRMRPGAELGLILFLGAFISAALSIVCAFGPYRTVAAASMLMILIAGAACWSAWHQRIWFAWLIPAGIQTPAALLWTIISSYLSEAKRRIAIRRAFSLYLSPHMADQISNARFDLKLGGELVEATMIFTDLEGFTSLSEQIHDPKEISEVLCSYFNNTTQHVLDNKGTIIKYIGDAVFATWGAPLADPDHAYHAVLGAWGMHQFSQLNVHGHQLVTRIGINTGTALAGNLGSDFRFDYTLIGDAVNFAARLENLNKHLGTKVLLSESTWEKVSSRFAARPVGQFVLMGKLDPVSIYELLGPSITHVVQARVDSFTEGLAAFCEGDLQKAHACMKRTILKYGGEDGPSEFYLDKIEHLQKNGLPPEWNGVIRMDEK